MSKFRYVAVNGYGVELNGTIDASSKDDAMEKLIENNIFPKEISKYRQGLDIKKHFHKVTFKEIVVFSRQFAFIINSGFPLLDGISVVREQMKNERLKEILHQVYRGVEKGGSLGGELEKYDEFPDLYVNMVKSAETSGNLGEILDRLAEYYNTQYKIKKKIASAMTYPMIVFGASLLIVSFIIIFILPKFIENIIDGGGKIPFITLIFMNISNIIINYGIFIIVIGGFLIYKFKEKLKNNRAMAIKLDRKKLDRPIFGKLNRMVIAAKFSRTLGTLLVSGIGIIEALDLCGKVVGNKYIENRMEIVKEKVEKGEAIGNSIRNIDVLPPILIQSIVVGERGGNLDEILAKTAVFYENDVEILATQLSSVIEPLIIIFLGGLIAIIAISMYLPLFSMYNAV